ncbi:MAG: hypothetical protein KJN92_02170, partial [Gemmatimonadetes bacterium]|nr:hypothetical protein [Gemmatimonadota bacterium]
FFPLQLTTPVELEPGNTFRRYAATDLVDAEIRTEVAPEPWSMPAEWIGIPLGLLLGAAGVAAYRLRAGKETPASGPEVPRAEREELLVSIAKLDEDFETHDNPSADQRDQYKAARDRLLSRLKRLS